MIAHPVLARRMSFALLALCAAFCLALLTTSPALADSVQIYDNAGVLNVSRVRTEASSLPKPIRIFTVPGYAGSNSAFDQEAKRQITSTSTIVIAINTRAHHLAIVGGSKVGLSSNDYSTAVSAFSSHFNGGDYTGATIAAIDSLKSSLNSSFSSVLGLVCLVGIVLLIGFAIFGFLRRRRGGPSVAPAFNAPAAYGPGYGAPGYGPGSPPQQGGVNPWVAGGLGAVGGGLLGYELGKLEGEREARHELEHGGYYGGGDFGGGASGDFGGGDFSGGGGGDFGGGGGGDFGGGDFGGGGGGDFGGGGGGDFGSSGSF